MANGILSQEEIDALLKAQAGGAAQPEAEALPPPEPPPGQALPDAAGGETAGAEGVEAPPAGDRLLPDFEVISDVEKDALGEVGNICMGSAATTLSMLLNQKVNITSPRVTITTLEELFKGFVTPHMTIYVSFIEGLSGYNLLIMRLQDAAVLADLMMGGDGTGVPEELTEMGVSAASEAMNQMIGSASTALATMFGRTVNISPPETKVYYSDADVKPQELGQEGPVVVIWFKMTVGEILDTRIMQVMGVETAREEAALILGQLSGIGGEEQAPAVEEALMAGPPPAFLDLPGPEPAGPAAPAPTPAEQPPQP
ncbi:MAG: flagellar motor switch phosphatase FliY, partial [Peptococcaceae bacterium]|nr:flagellar motor switch phosphatase FliY [Peptococcaceae bacterium]